MASLLFGLFNDDAIENQFQRMQRIFIPFRCFPEILLSKRYYELNNIKNHLNK